MSLLSSSALTNPPSKIMLSSTSKISLNDRFTKIEKIKPKVDPVVKLASVATIASTSGPTLAAKLPASAKNRRLALQMANRPSVQAALKNKTAQQQQQQQNNGRISGALANNKANNINSNNNNINSSAASRRPGSLSSRLGNRPGSTAAKPEISAAALAATGAAAKKIDPTRLTVGGVPLTTKLSLKKRLGPPVQSRIARVGSMIGKQRASLGENRIGKNQAAGRALNNQQSKLKTKRLLNSSLPNRRSGQGKPGGINKAKPNSAPQKPKSKEVLDVDLDQYMAKSKYHLDTDLDSYMAQANTTM